MKHGNLILFAICLMISSFLSNVPFQVSRYGFIGAIFYVIISAFAGLYLPTKMVLLFLPRFKRFIVKRRNNDES